MWYKNICSASFSFVTMHACDRQTDGQNYDSQDRLRICSRGKTRCFIVNLRRAVGTVRVLFLLSSETNSAIISAAEIQVCLLLVKWLLLYRPIGLSVATRMAPACGNEQSCFTSYHSKPLQLIVIAETHLTERLETAAADVQGSLQLFFK